MTEPLQQEYVRLQGLPGFHHRKHWPPLVVEHLGYKARKGCYGEVVTLRDRHDEIRVYLYPWLVEEEARITLLHEMIHLAVCSHRHDATFRACYLRAIREAWGIDLWGWHGPLRDLEWEVRLQLAPSRWSRVRTLMEQMFENLG